MARYIDADLLREKMYHKAFEEDSSDQKWDSGCWIRYHMFEDAIESMQTADVVERRHGNWVKTEESKFRPYMCSECGALFDVDTVMGELTWRFCPACGTQMKSE